MSTMPIGFIGLWLLYCMPCTLAWCNK